jgi:hypothetical protein
MISNFQVMCTKHEVCSAQGVTVTVTVSDSCRSALCAQTNNPTPHFDMTGHQRRSQRRS